jgi:hypothetical protein
MTNPGSSVDVLLFCVIILETTIIFGDWINDMASCGKSLYKSKDPQSQFYGFTNKDSIELGVDVSVLLIILWFSIVYIVPLYTSVLTLINRAGVPASLSHISLTFLFVAIVLTITVNTLNHISNVFTRVNSRRNRDNALHERLDAIEDALHGVEKNVRTDRSFNCGESNGFEDRVRNKQNPYPTRYHASYFFVVVGIAAIIVGIVLNLGETSSIYAAVAGGGTFTPSEEAAVSAIIAGAMALYGAGIAVLLFGADLYIKIKSEINVERDNEQLLKSIDELRFQNRRIMEILLDGKK